MSDQAPLVSIVIPCRNESVRLPGTLQALEEFLDQTTMPGEILIVVEKGDDGTDRLAEEQARRDSRFRAICNSVARGKGYAVTTGMLAARGAIIFFMDADLSVPLRFVPAFLPFFEDGADVVFGSRRHPESVIPQRQPMARVVFGRIFNLGLRVFGVTEFKDTQCGFKAFRREAAQEIFPRVAQNGFGFDVEVLLLARLLGYRIVERPVEWSDAPGSKVRALPDGIASFREAVLAAWRVKREIRP